MEPNDEDWEVIQESLEGDCPMMIVGQLQRGEISPTQALERIAAYATVAFERGYIAAKELGR
jgi:hypothetical protein